MKRIFNYEYLTKEHLIGLDNYKYSSIDTSPLSKYVTHPFWNFLVNYFPMWLAPNLITFVGFLCLIVQFILFSIYDYSFYGYCFNRDQCLPVNALNQSLAGRDFQTNLLANPQAIQIPALLCSCIPRWLWLVLFVTQFLAHHLDGIDGKQARRTGSSTPLGELFDHGLDSWATLFLPVAIFSLFNRSETYGISVMQQYGLLWLILGTFIVSHWEKYNTGILFLPWSYDMAQLGMEVAFFATYVMGQDFYYFHLDFLGIGLLRGVSLARAAEICIYTFAIGLSLPPSLYNMRQAFINKTFKQPSFWEGVRPLMSTVYLFVLQMIWLSYSKIKILHLEPRAFYWLTGTLFANIACRLIIAQMTKTRCRIYNSGLILLTFVVFMFTCPLADKYAQYLTPEMEIKALYATCLLVTLSHIHYGICVVRQICNHLNIYCFKITSRPPKKSE
jgi:ethanolaminephosphotransferase